MVDPVLQPVQTDRQLTKDPLSVFRDNVAMPGILIAVLYGLGWVLQYGNFLQLRIGPISPSRESAIAAAIAFSAVYLPILTLGFGPKSARDLIVTLPWWALLAALSVYMVFVVLAIVIPQELSRASEVILLYLVWVTMNLAAILVSRRQPMTAQALVTAGICPVLVAAFVTTGMPHLKPIFGGYLLSPVGVRSKLDAVSGNRLIVVADSEYVVLSRAASANQFWDDFTNYRGANLERLRWDDVELMTTPER